MRIASDALSVKISGRLRVALRRTWRSMIRHVEVPITRAASTYASCLRRTVSARTTRKYCGMKTTVIEIAVAMTPLKNSARPPEMTIAATIASRSEGKA